MSDLKTSILEIDLKKHGFLIDKFLRNAGDSLQSFTYFKNRPISCIDNHLATFLLMLDSEPIGYAHLDPEDNKIWFGICIAQNHKGKKHGNFLINYIINYTKSKKYKSIFLSVHKDNKAAIKLYNKYKFNIYSENKKSFFMRKDFQCQIH